MVTPHLLRGLENRMPQQVRHDKVGAFARQSFVTTLESRFYAQFF